MVILTPITINNHFNNANYVTKVDHLCSERHTFNFLLKKVDFRAYPVPMLALFTENNYNEIESDAYGGIYHVNKFVIGNAKDGRIVSFKNARHMDFTDLPLFSPFLGSMLGHGDVDSEKMMTTVNGIVLDWFNYYLKGEGVLDIKAQY